MAKKEANLTAIGIVQQLDESYWHWEDTSSIQQAKEGNCKPLLEEITKKLEENDIKVKECYGIVHDKDKQTVWDEEKRKDVIKDKETHIHALLKFEKGASLEKIAVSVGVEPQYLEKLKSGRYGYDNSLSYLVHAKDEDKYSYNPKDVITIRGESYESIYSKRIDAWIKGKATKKVMEIREEKNWLIHKILKGNIAKENIILNDEYYFIYGQYKRLINDAFDTYYEKKSLKIIEDLENGKFKKTIIFITGDSGSGKTKFAKLLIALIKKTSFYYVNEIWQHCITASKNAFDEYNAQEILLLDDIRGKSLDVSDWLKLLDPYSISPISARYHNKQAVSKIIIITNPELPYDFFNTVEDSKSEDFNQFLRRLDLNVRVDSNFFISTVEKKELKATKEVDFLLDKKDCYVLSEEKEYNQKEALRLILDKIVENMKWKKEDYPPTDQSKQDNQ